MTKKSDHGYQTGTYVEDASAGFEWIDAALNPGHGPSNSVRQIKTTKGKQVIISSTAMNNVGKGFLVPEDRRSSSINHERFGAGSIDVGDMDNLKHSTGAGSDAHDSAFSERVMRADKPVVMRGRADIFSYLTDDEKDARGPDEDD